MRWLEGLLLCLFVSGCAWANRENRPAWNAFEEHLVPQHDVAFATTLPLTIPGGLVAILVDTLVLHPVSVVDDAGRDTAELWAGLDWNERYYTELASLPLRGIATPLAFAGSYLARSLFDLVPHGSAAEAAALSTRREREWIVWFDQLAVGSNAGAAPAGRAPWSDELEGAFLRARERAGPLKRYTLFRCAQLQRLPPWEREPDMGLRDRDPVVRYRILDAWPIGTTIDEDTRRALLNDPNETVRALAQRRWSSD